jgi:hypothetical protein
MSELPKEKLTVADLVEAQRKTAYQLDLIATKLNEISFTTTSIARSDQSALSANGWNGVLLFFLIIGSILNQSFIAFELALIAYCLAKSLHRTPALKRAKELDDEEKLRSEQKEQDATQWEMLFGKKKNKPLTPPSA